MAEINTSEGWAGTNPRSGSVHDGYLCPTKNLYFSG
jgi:hypothetical protein